MDTITEPASVPREVLERNLAQINKKIALACENSDRNPDDITLMAVTKNQNSETVEETLNMGLRLFGENKYQEMDYKRSVVASHKKDTLWHFIGQIQRNKLSRICSIADAIHSIDASWQIDTVAKSMRKPDLYLQLFNGDDETRGGVSPLNASKLIAHAKKLSITFAGVMMMPPPDTDPRPHFTMATEFAHDNGLVHISMGMSHDFDVAIECGATIIRLGTALFGARTP